MNNKAAQKAVAYLCDSHNWHTKLANHKIAPILSFVASPIFLEMQDHLKIARKSFLCPAKKNGAKVNEASKCFPVWQQSSFKDTSLTRVMPNDDRWEQYEYTLHRLYVQVKAHLEFKFQSSKHFIPFTFCWEGGRSSMNPTLTWLSY